ncbi:hypothetical protein FRX31_004912 [Thalictrum thalictroides]|uniref:Uncharacterized protein n=1 Tax=Thalictrum thalictroides TaxID=46969 RepID=A0A7J6X7B0_THATH|nr:hypothetical protein FRX31_004912 [Thalictrum thalictroides]
MRQYQDIAGDTRDNFLASQTHRSQSQYEDNTFSGSGNGSFTSLLFGLQSGCEEPIQLKQSMNGRQSLSL